MKAEWSSILFDLMPYKETGTCILKSPDEALQLLDDHIVMTQSMSFSPYKKAFEAEINKWESKLRTTQVSSKGWRAAGRPARWLTGSFCAPALWRRSQDVLEEWLLCQGSWLYLEPIFSSDDINEQLPVEGKRYQQMEEIWKRIMKGASDNPKVSPTTANGGHAIPRSRK